MKRVKHFIKHFIIFELSKSNIKYRSKLLCFSRGENNWKVLSLTYTDLQLHV